MNKIFDYIVYLFAGSGLGLGFWNIASKFGTIAQISTLLLTLVSIVLVVFKVLNEIKKYRKKSK